MVSLFAGRDVVPRWLLDRRTKDVGRHLEVMERLVVGIMIHEFVLWYAEEEMGSATAWLERNTASQRQDPDHMT